MTLFRITNHMVNKYTLEQLAQQSDDNKKIALWKALRVAAATIDLATAIPLGLLHAGVLIQFASKKHMYTRKITAGEINDLKDPFATHQLQKILKGLDKDDKNKINIDKCYIKDQEIHIICTDNKLIIIQTKQLKDNNVNVIEEASDIRQEENKITTPKVDTVETGATEINPLFNIIQESLDNNFHNSTRQTINDIDYDVYCYTYHNSNQQITITILQPTLKSQPIKPATSITPIEEKSETHDTQSVTEN